MKNFVLILVCGIALLSLAAVVKKKDAIQLTQTDPIAYKDKVKEEAEGKKGPPAPTLELFPKEKFLAEGPVAKSDKASLTPEEEEWELWLGEEEEKGEAEFKLGRETDDMKEAWSDIEDESWEFEQ